VFVDAPVPACRSNAVRRHREVSRSAPVQRGAASVCSTPLARLGVGGTASARRRSSARVSRPPRRCPRRRRVPRWRQPIRCVSPVGSSRRYRLPPPAAITVVAAGYVVASGTVPDALGGVTLATLATAALLVTVVCGYLFPAAVVSVRDGTPCGSPAGRSPRYGVEHVLPRVGGRDRARRRRMERACDDGHTERRRAPRAWVVCLRPRRRRGGSSPRASIELATGDGDPRKRKNRNGSGSGQARLT